MGCYDWNRYNAKIGLTTKAELSTASLFNSGSTSHIALSIDSLTIKAVPQTGQGGTAIRLYDGTRQFVTPRWTYEIDLNWAEATDAEWSDIADIVTLAMGTSVGAISGATNGEFQLGFDYSQLDGSASGYVITCVPDLTEATISAIFNRRVREKSVSLKFYSTSSDSAIIAGLLV